MRFWTGFALSLVIASVGPSIDASAKTTTKSKAAVSSKSSAKSKASARAKAAAANAEFRRALDRLDPQTRLEQVCDLEAMNRIKKDKKYSPDRAQGAASAEPRTEGHKLTSTGGAFRSKGEWFELSFVCVATPDHTKVLSLEYQTGKPIPQAKWEEYGLWR